VQQIKIEIIGAEASKAALAGTYYAIPTCMIWQHFRNQKDSIALTSNHAALRAPMT
jgi:hypothetical protein